MCVEMTPMGSAPNLRGQRGLGAGLGSGRNSSCSEGTECKL